MPMPKIKKNPATKPKIKHFNVEIAAIKKIYFRLKYLRISNMFAVLLEVYSVINFVLINTAQLRSTK